MSNVPVWTEEELLPISALQHLLFCPRQCALIHIARVWSDNSLTAAGRIMHERVDAGGHETRHGIRTEFGVRIRSLQLGIAGIADVVEFISDRSSCSTVCTPRPVEYKHGRPKVDASDKVQLCAQALCLEEMCSTKVPIGVLYYGAERLRHVVEFDDELRELTIEMTARLRRIFHAVELPVAIWSSKCRSCSLIEACMPKVTNVATGYIQAEYDALEAACESC